MRFISRRRWRCVRNIPALPSQHTTASWRPRRKPSVSAYWGAEARLLRLGHDGAGLELLELAAQLGEEGFALANPGQMLFAILLDRVGQNLLLPYHAFFGLDRAAHVL